MNPAALTSVVEVQRKLVLPKKYAVANAEVIAKMISSVPMI